VAERSPLFSQCSSGVAARSALSGRRDMTHLKAVDQALDEKQVSAPSSELTLALGQQPASLSLLGVDQYDPRLVRTKRRQPNRHNRSRDKPSV